MQPPDDVGIRVAVVGGADHRPGDEPGPDGLRPQGRAVGTAAAAARLGARVDLLLLTTPASPWATPPGAPGPDPESVALALPVTGEPVRVTVAPVVAPPEHEAALDHLDGADAVVVAPGGNGVPLAEAALMAGRAVGALTVLHPDLSCPDIVSAFGYADVITINLRDAPECPTRRQAVEQLAGDLLAYGPELVAASAGALGTLFAWTDAHVWWPAPAAADRAPPARVAEALTAGLAAALAEGQAYPEATRFAAATSALATRLPGTPEPFPSRRQVQRLLAQPWHDETLPTPSPVPCPGGG